MPIPAAGLQNPWDIDLLVEGPSPSSADFDGDGDVDGNDFLGWQVGLSTNDAARIDGDANGDGAVDGADLTIWRDQFGGQNSAGVVPEPLSAVQVAIAALIAICARFP
jgi:hypothetical protein